MKQFGGFKKIGSIVAAVLLIWAMPASSQQRQRNWPLRETVTFRSFDSSAASQVRFPEWHLTDAHQEARTFWRRGALIGGGVGGLMGALAAWVPANVINDGSPAYVSEYTFTWGAIGLLIGAALGAAIGNEYDRPAEK